MTSGITSRIDTIRKGRDITDVIGSASTNEACALALIFGRLDLMSAAYAAPADAWQRLDEAGRDIVRRYAPRRAAAAERAAARAVAQSDPSRKPGRPALGGRAMSPAERKRRSRQAAGAATTEAIDRAIIFEIQKYAAFNPRWLAGLTRAVAAHFPDADEERVARRIYNS